MLPGQFNPSPQPQHGNHYQYYDPSVVKPGPSIPKYRFAPQGDNASWDGNPNSLRTISSVAPSSSFSSDSSHGRESDENPHLCLSI